MTLKEKINEAIETATKQLEILRAERDNLEKKKHFNWQLECAYEKRCDDIQALRNKLSAYLEVLKWIDEE